MSCSHPAFLPVHPRRRCDAADTAFVVEASGITQMRLFSERNVHSRYKAARVQPRTELKKEKKERKRERGKGAETTKGENVPPRYRSAYRGQYFLC